jgi:hypothetical protein
VLETMIGLWRYSSRLSQAVETAQVVASKLAVICGQQETLCIVVFLTATRATDSGVNCLLVGTSAELRRQ